MTGSTDPLAQLCELLAAGCALVDSHEKAFRSIEANASDPDWCDVVSASQFRWLVEKFRFGWHDDAGVDGALRAAASEATTFTATDFEGLVQAILGLVDGRRYQTTQASHDEGIDLIDRVSLDLDFCAEATTIVQCKLYRGFVPVTEVRDFFGAMTAKVATGLFFTTGRLTAQAQRFLPQANNSPFANRFHLVEGNDLRRLLLLCGELADLVIDGSHVGSGEAEAIRARRKALREAAKAIVYSNKGKAVPDRQGRLL